MLDGFPNDIVIEYPLLQLHKERLEEIQQVESFRALHEHPYASFDFVPDVEVDVVKPGYTLPVSDIANLPRLTLTHMRDSRSADTIRIAAAIGKVRGYLLAGRQVLVASFVKGVNLTRCCPFYCR